MVVSSFSHKEQMCCSVHSASEPDHTNDKETRSLTWLGVIRSLGAGFWERIWQIRRWCKQGEVSIIWTCSWSRSGGDRFRSIRSGGDSLSAQNTSPLHAEASSFKCVKCWCRKPLLRFLILFVHRELEHGKVSGLSAWGRPFLSYQTESFPHCTNRHKHHWLPRVLQTRFCKKTKQAKERLQIETKRNNAGNRKLGTEGSAGSLPAHLLW